MMDALDVYMTARVTMIERPHVRIVVREEDEPRTAIAVSIQLHDEREPAERRRYVRVPIGREVLWAGHAWAIEGLLRPALDAFPLMARCRDCGTEYPARHRYRGKWGALCGDCIRWQI